MGNQSKNVALDDNGNVQGTVPEVKDVQAGDVVSYVLQPAKSANWQFVGYTSNTDGAITNVTIDQTGKQINLTIGTGTSGEQVDVTIVYYLDLTGLQMPLGSTAPDGSSAIVKSNDPVIKFK